MPTRITKIVLLPVCGTNRRAARARRWWQLPEVGVWPQLALLGVFQRLVELQESTRILMDLGQPAHNPNHQYAELKVRPRTAEFHLHCPVQCAALLRVAAHILHIHGEPRLEGA